MSNQAEQDPMAKATIAAEELYHIRETYFPANPDEKISKLQTESDLALKLLDSVPPGYSSFHFNRKHSFLYFSISQKFPGIIRL